MSCDRVAAKLGNTRAVSRSSYVDPLILERFFPNLYPNYQTWEDE